MFEPLTKLILYCLVWGGRSPSLPTVYFKWWGIHRHGGAILGDAAGIVDLLQSSEVGPLTVVIEHVLSFHLCNNVGNGA